MPDRPLTEEETKKFVQEHAGNIFSGLKAFQEEKTKPSLHDLCISELNAKTEGLKRIVIQQGRDLMTITAAQQSILETIAILLRRVERLEKVGE